MRQLQHLDATPRLTLKKASASDQLELTNESDGDLAPRFADETEAHGYVLEIEADTPIFREAEEGEFWRVRGEIEREGRASVVMIPLATRLGFSFSQLRAGQSLKTGLIRLAPASDFSHTRFRIIPNPQSAWTPFAK